MKQRLANLVLCLLASSLVSICVLVYGTAQGIGVSADSCVYLGAARNLVAGQGLLNGPGPGIPAGEPLLHYPPLYPVVLALLLKVDLTMEQAATVLNAMSLALTLTVVCWLFCRVDRPLAGWVSVALLLALPGFLAAHLMVWSEPLFLALLMLFLLSLHRAQERGGLSALVVAGLMAGLVALTRNAGLACVATGGLYLLLQTDRSWFQRIGHAMVFGCSAVCLIGTWMLRNAVVAGRVSDEELTWHPPGFWHLATLKETLLEWILPPGTPVWVSSLRSVAWLLVVVLLLGVWRSSRTTPRKKGIAMSTILYLTFMVTYGLLVLFSVSFVDTLVPLDDRLLLPLVMVLVIWLVNISSHGSQPSSTIMTRLAWLSVLGIVITGMPAQWALLRHAHAHGLEFTSDAWNGDAWRWIDSQEPGTRMWSNAPDLVYARTGRVTRELPAKINPFSKRTRTAEFTQEMESLRLDVESDHAVIIFVKGFEWRWQCPSFEELVTVLHVREVRQFGAVSVLTK